jgi:hypothetical protein
MKTIDIRPHLSKEQGMIDKAIDAINIQQFKLGR